MTLKIWEQKATMAALKECFELALKSEPRIVKIMLTEKNEIDLEELQNYLLSQKVDTRLLIVPSLHYNDRIIEEGFLIQVIDLD